MSIIDTIILAIVQGITEFAPISSTGHLIIVRDLLGLPLRGTLAFDAVLQLATAFSILVYFRRDWRGILRPLYIQKESRLLTLLVVATVPAVVAGLFLEETMDTLLRTTPVVAFSLIVGAFVMWMAERMYRGYNNRLKFRGALLIGVFQSFALLPGMSRAGSTISGGMFTGLSREESTRFAFLLGFPILFGSGTKKLLEIGLSTGISFELVLGSLISFSVGLAVIHYLLKFLKNHSLNVFVLYRLLLALLLILFI